MMTDTALTAAANNLPSDLNQLTVEIKFYVNQWGQNTIEIGKRLIAAKNLVGHGEFGKWLEDNFNMTVRTAQRFIKCAENFGNATMSSHLKPSQMFEMLVLTPEETEKFIAEKTAKGTPVEDMTVKQLRAEVAEYKAELAKKKSEVKELREDRDGLNEIISTSEATIKNLTAEKNQLEQANANLTKQRDEAAEQAAKAEVKNSELELKLQNQTEKIVEKPVVPADYDDIKNQLAEKQTQIARLEQELAAKDTTIEVQPSAELEQARKELAKLQAELNEYSELAVIVQSFEIISRQIDGIYFSKNIGKALKYYEQNAPKEYRQFLARVTDFYNLIKE